MKYTDYDELSDMEETATAQVETAKEVIRKDGVNRAFNLAKSGYLKADAIEVAMSELSGEVQMLRDSPEYNE